MFLVCFFDPSEVRDRKLIFMVHSASKRSMKCWQSLIAASSFFLRADDLRTCAHCFMLCPSCKASEGTFTSNRDSSLNSHSSFTVTATIIVTNVGKVITPFSLFSLFPSPPESMLDKTKFVFVRNYSYLSQH